LGGSRKGILRTVLNLFVVWALTGLWHGASWNFVLWGLYFFVFIALEKLFLGKLLKKAKGISNFYLLVIVFFGWILFKFENLNDIWTVLKGMFCANGNAFCDFETLTILKSNIVFLVLCILCCTPLFSGAYKKLEEKAISSKGVFAVYSIVNILIPLALLGVSVAALIGNSYNPFLYFKF
jgi:alginate O-acetyltransferase complex protein AlgI